MKTRMAVTLVALLALCAGGGWYYLDQRIRGEIDARLQDAVEDGDFESLSYEELDYGLDGRLKLGTVHIRQQGLAYTVDEVELLRFDSEHEIPHELELSVSGLRFEEPLPDNLLGNRQSPFLDYLRSLEPGQSLPFRLHYSHSYQELQDGTLDTTLEMEIPGLANLDWSSSMSKVELDKFAELSRFSEDPVVLQTRTAALLGQTEINAVNLELEDLGLLQNWMESAAGEYNANPEDYRRMLISQARNAYLFMPSNAQDRLQDYGEELALFLEGDGTLHVSLQPDFDGSLQQLQGRIMGAALTGDIRSILQLLNLEIRKL